MKTFFTATILLSVYGRNCCAAADLATPASLQDSLRVILSEPLNPALLEKYNEEVLENPRKYKRRWQRALILLQHGDTAQTTAEDIDSLLAQPLWRGQGLRLKAMYRYLQRRFDEARDLMRQNILDGTNVVEQAGFLAKIALSEKDTNAAIAAYRLGWDQHPDENVYVELLHAYGRWKAPMELLDEGLRLYPNSPGILQVLFESYLNLGNSAGLQKSLLISARAEETLWPMSVDWKIKHAQALFSLNRPHEAEPILLAALDLMDGDPRLEGENGQFRKKIFAMLETIRK